MRRKVKPGLPHVAVEWHLDSSHLIIWLSIMSLYDLITDAVAFYKVAAESLEKIETYLNVRNYETRGI